MSPFSQQLKQVAGILETTPQTLAVMLAPLDEAVLTARPAPNEWSIKEVIGHLVETDIHAFGGRIEWMLAEERPVLPAWDMKGAVAARRDNERALPSLLDELAAGRMQWLPLVRSLEEDSLSRPAVHRVGELTIGDFLFEWPYHDFNHISQIAGNIRAVYLPLMGELMRRSLS